MPHNLFNTLQTFSLTAGKTGEFYSLPQLEKEGVGSVSKLPVSIRVVLESVLRNFDGQKITEDDVRAIANWQATAERTEEVPFVGRARAAPGLHRRAFAGRSGCDAICGGPT
jgi:aconitate hydratase